MSSVDNFARQAAHRYCTRVTSRSVDHWIRSMGLPVARTPGIRQRLIPTKRAFEIIDANLAAALASAENPPA